MLKILYLQSKTNLLILVCGLFLLQAFSPALVRGEDKGPLGKITFIHYKNGPAVGRGVERGGNGLCYDYIVSGAKWRIVKDYIINPTNSNLAEAFVRQAVDNGVAEWENYGGTGIFGSSSIDPAFPAIGANNDSKNVVSFGPWDDNNVIALTTVWGYFSGPPKLREITEWDILFNTFYPWGDATSVGNSVMDLQDIATHELGHAAGMDDLYRGVCSDETMYGYSSYGETEDRTLNTGDIRGITKLYR